MSGETEQPHEEKGEQHTQERNQQHKRHHSGSSRTERRFSSDHSDASATTREKQQRERSHSRRWSRSSNENARDSESSHSHVKNATSQSQHAAPANQKPATKNKQESQQKRTKPETAGKFHGRTLLWGKSVPPRHVPLQPLYLSRKYSSSGERYPRPEDPRLHYYASGGLERRLTKEKAEDLKKLGSGGPKKLFRVGEGLFEVYTVDVKLTNPLPRSRREETDAHFSQRERSRSGSECSLGAELVKRVHTQMEVASKNMQSHGATHRTSDKRERERKYERRDREMSATRNESRISELPVDVAVDDYIPAPRYRREKSDTPTPFVDVAVASPVRSRTYDSDDSAKKEKAMKCKALRKELRAVDRKLNEIHSRKEKEDGEVTEDDDDDTNDDDSDSAQHSPVDKRQRTSVSPPTGSEHWRTDHNSESRRRHSPQPPAIVDPWDFMTETEKSPARDPWSNATDSKAPDENYSDYIEAANMLFREAYRDRDTHSRSHHHRSRKHHHSRSRSPVSRRRGSKHSSSGSEPPSPASAPRDKRRSADHDRYTPPGVDGVDSGYIL